MTKTYEIPVKLIFEGTVYVKGCTSLVDAVEDIRENFSGILRSAGNFDNESSIDNWNFDVHSTKTVVPMKSLLVIKE